MLDLSEAGTPYTGSPYIKTFRLTDNLLIILLLLEHYLVFLGNTHRCNWGWFFAAMKTTITAVGCWYQTRVRRTIFRSKWWALYITFANFLLVSLNPRLKFHSCFLQTIEQQQIIQLIHPTYYWWIPWALLRWWYLVDRSDLVTSNVWAIISTMVSKETPGSIAIVLWIEQGGVRHGGVSRIAALKVSFLFLSTWFSPANKRWWWWQ